MNKKRNTISTGQYIFGILSFLLVWAFFAGNYFNEDYENYVDAFYMGIDRYADLKIEPLFALITHSFQKAGINDFFLFRSIIAFVFMIPYWYVLITKSDKAIWSIIIYIPLFLLNIVILRNFMAFSIAMIGMLFLYKGGKKNKLIFLAFLLIAEGIHNLMFVYLLLLLLDVDLKLLKRPILYFILCCIVGVLLSTFITETISNLETTKYSSSELGRSIRVILGVPLLINYLFMKYVYKNSTESPNENIKKFERGVLRTNLIMIAVVCFFTININSSRLNMNLFVLNSVFIANRLLRHKRDCGIMIPLSFFVIGLQWYYMCAFVLGIQFEELFKYNYFFNFGF